MNNERVNSRISSPTPPIPCPTDTVTGCQGAAGVTPASASPDDTCSPFTSSIRSQLPVLGQPDGEGHWGRGEEKRQDPISSPLLLPAGPCRSKSMPLPALWASADRAQLSGWGPRWGQGCLVSQGCEHGSPLPHFRGLWLPPPADAEGGGGAAGACWSLWLGDGSQEQLLLRRRSSVTGWEASSSWSLSQPRRVSSSVLWPHKSFRRQSRLQADTML